jgi:hypothetical protein
MRVAAGICLILAAILNLFGALGYLGGGALTAGVSHLGQAAVEEAARQDGRELSAADRSQLEIATTVGKGIGGLLLAMGVFLLVSTGILVAGAVFLFQGTHWKFILGSGVVAIAAEVFGILLTTFGMTNVLGIIGGALAIVSAAQLRKLEAAPPA